MSTQILTRLSGAAALLLLGVSALPATAAAQGSIAASWQASAFDAQEAPRLWTRGGSIDPAAATLVSILRRAHLDGMAANEMVARDVERAIESGNLDAAERLLSSAWVHYVETLRRPVDVGMTYADPSLAPAAPSADEILAEAAAAPSLERHLEAVARVNPLYAQIREGLAAREAAAGDLSGDKLAQALRINLDRARVLPSSGRYILVDAAAQRLWMYEDGEVQGSMKVIVGKAEDPTPMLAGRVNRAVVNPYWNVPPDLVRERVAPAVLKQGRSYIAQQNYELLSGWEADAVPIDADEVDWSAVADGREQLRVRQRPGPGNGMGDIKFMFPNQFGVYLHDTPGGIL